MKQDGTTKPLTRTTTIRLGLSYLAIIMLMSVAFSFVFYRASAHELGRQIPARSVFDRRFQDAGLINPHDFLERRSREGKSVLLEKLIILNVLAFALGSIVSYILARQTLQPIEQTIDAQNRFISDASHELRTPLTALQSSNEVALRKPRLTIKQAKAILQSNVEEANKLRDLINNLLHLATQNHQPMDMQTIDVQEIVTSAINQIIHSAQSKHILVDDKIPSIIITGNQQSLIQVLVILLDNAIKFSKLKSTIHIAAHAKDESSYISVRDEGHGIAKQDLPFIFDRFYQADQARSKQQYKGHGLGLAIAQKIINTHQGTITVASTVGKGSTFTIKLPITKAFS